VSSSSRSAPSAHRRGTNARGSGEQSRGSGEQSRVETPGAWHPVAPESVLPSLRRGGVGLLACADKLLMQSCIVMAEAVAQTSRPGRAREPELFPPSVEMVDGLDIRDHPHALELSHILRGPFLRRTRIAINRSGEDFLFSIAGGLYSVIALRNTRSKVLFSHSRFIPPQRGFRVRSRIAVGVGGPGCGGATRQTASWVGNRVSGW